MDSLNAFFKQEREKVFEPDVDFCGRVMSRLAQPPVKSESLWESVLATSRPALAAVVACMAIVIGLYVLSPAEPSRGPSQIYLESELTSDEQLLYLAPEPLPTAVVFQELISPEAQ